MAKLLFRLRNVPEDEADEVRELLDEHGFDYYETSPGNWGISMPGIWLKDDDQLEAARAVLKDYQQQRARRAREEYEALRRSGEAQTWLDMLRENPGRFIGYLALAAAVLYISVSIFFNFE